MDHPSETSSIPASDVIESICDVQDIFAEVIQYCQPLEIFAIGVTCKKYLDGFCWFFVRHVDIVKMHHALFRNQRMGLFGDQEKAMRAVSRVLKFGVLISSLYFDFPPEHEHAACLDVLLFLLEGIANQLSSFRFGSRRWKKAADVVLPRLNPQRLLHLWGSHPVQRWESSTLLLNSIDQVEFWCQFSQLKSLSITIPTALFEPAISHIAAKLKKLENLRIRFQDEDASFDPLPALAKAVVANEGTRWKRLEFQPHVEKVFENATTMLGYSFSMALPFHEFNAKFRSKFGVSLSGFRANWYGMWEAYEYRKAQRSAPIELSDTLFQLCHGSGFSVKAANALQHAFDSDSGESIPYFLEKVANWVCDPCWSLRTLKAIEHIGLLINAVLEFIRRKPQYQKRADSYLCNIAQEFRRLFSEWPRDALARCLVPGFLAFLMASDEEWAKRTLSCLHFAPMVDRFTYASFVGDDPQGWKAFVNCSGEFPFEPANFNKMLRNLFSNSSGDKQIIALQTYMAAFRQNPKYLGSLINLHSSWYQGKELSYFLHALLGDEKRLLYLFKQQHDMFSHYKLLPGALKAVDVVTGKPILSSDEVDLVSFYFIKTKFEAAGTTERLGKVAQILLDSFGSFPKRINQWIADPSVEDIKLKDGVDRSVLNSLLH